MKTTFLFASMSAVISLLSTGSADALTFTFKQQGITQESFVTGTFTGEDLNNDNRLDLGELESFEALIFDSVPLSNNNLTNFEYILGTSNSIAFGAQKRLDVEDEETDYRVYNLSLSGFDSFSGLSILFYREGEPDPLIVADAKTNQPVYVQPIPEPITLLGAATAIGIGAAFKKFEKK